MKLLDILNEIKIIKKQDDLKIFLNQHISQLKTILSELDDDEEWKDYIDSISKVEYVDLNNKKIVEPQTNNGFNLSFYIFSKEEYIKNPDGNLEEQGLEHIAWHEIEFYGEKLYLNFYDD